MVDPASTNKSRPTARVIAPAVDQEHNNAHLEPDATGI